MSFTSCFSLLLIILYCALVLSAPLFVVVVVVPSGIGGGKNGPATPFLLSRGLCVPTIVREMECITSLILLKFQGLPF